PGQGQRILDVCERWGLEAAVIGRVTDTNRFVCKATPHFDPFVEPEGPRHPIIAVDLPIGILADEAPKYDRPTREPTPPREDPIVFPGDANLQDELLSLLGSPNIGSRSAIWRQFDHIVRNGTVIGPGAGDAAVIRAFCGDGLEKFLALSVDCNGRHVALDPFVGGQMAVAECARNIVCVGARPLGVTDCLNFGNPQIPETMWTIVRAIEGIATACQALGTPVVSGNVSLYNETDGRPILPTPTIGMVGQLDDPEHRLTLAFLGEGDRVLHLGAMGGGALGGSEWQVRRDGRPRGPAVPFDLASEVRLQQLMLHLAQQRLLRSAHDISDGGLAICLAESCIAGQVGARIQLPPSDVSRGATLFGEEPSRVIVSVSPDEVDHILDLAKTRGVHAIDIGAVGGSSLHFDADLDLPLDLLVGAHAGALDAVLGPAL
ncbi:MAG: phosphoribosylformylglycinamidine synthase II, partial [Myxococcales bacterium]|nr:phosphoribosylformylglycinamidine synthase II [Myxococcales bacterium]